jgi:hypothetical protein
VTKVSHASTQIAGILLLTIVAVESGGVFLLRVARGRLARTPIQRTFERAGHAHAGVLVLLSLVVQPYVDAAGISGLSEAAARDAVPIAAILMPAGYFLSVARPGTERPNRLVILIWLGAASLAVGVVTLGIALLRA